MEDQFFLQLVMTCSARIRCAIQSPWYRPASPGIPRFTIAGNPSNQRKRQRRNERRDDPVALVPLA